LAEGDIGFPDQDEIDGMGIQYRVFRGGSVWRGKQPSLRLRCTQSEEYPEGESGRGSWPSKVVSAIPGTECPPSWVMPEGSDEAQVERVRCGVHVVLSALWSCIRQHNR
jgi:hypothetical protein